MGRPHILAGPLAAALLLVGCSSTTTTPPASGSPATGSPGTGSPSAESPSPPRPEASVATPGRTAEGTAPRTGPDGRPFVVAERARFGEPWAMAFLPGTPWLAVTERSGAFVLVDPLSGERRPVAGAPQVVDAGQGGLGDVVPGPTFASDQTVYLSWAEAGPGGFGAAVGRARLVTEGSARLEGLEVIWRQQPKVSGHGHFAHRLAFSADGQYLFVTSGDRQKMEPAQDLSNNLGSLVRLTLDGRPAPGNPFADQGGVAAEIWSYGHRNPLGLAFDADGRLWSTEMGPQGGDELNLIVRGANYGWPRASNGSHYGGGRIPDHADGDGFEAPQVFWTPSVSPSSLMIYNGDSFPGWKGDAFVGALSGEALIRVDLEGTSARAADQWPMGQRIREVEQSPDGSIWLLEDAPGGRLLHLTPP